VILVSSPFILLLGGGIAMCCLYKPGERIGSLGYWILAVMLTPYFLMILLMLVWREREDDEPDEADE
jgi:hypothetical protein